MSLVAKVTLLLTAMFALASPVLAQVSADEAQQELLQIQSELKERQSNLAKSQASAQEIEAVLRQSELEIGKVAGALNATQQSLSKKSPRATSTDNAPE